MTYTKQTWVNGVGGGTPINASRLNYMEDGIEAASTSSPTIYVEDYGPFVDATADERRTTIAAATAIWALTGGTLEYPGGTFDMSGGTAALPLTFLNLHTTYHIKGNNTRFTTTTAHPIFADSLPADNTAAVNRASRRFVVEHCHFQGSGLVGQIGIRIIGSYLSIIRGCSFQSLDTGLDAIFCLGITVASCGFATCINFGQRHRYGMEIDDGAYYALWSGAAQTNSNGNCPLVIKCRDYGAPALTTATITNRERGPSARNVNDAVLNSTTTLVSATASFTRADRGAVVTNAAYPGGDTVITRFVDSTTVITSEAATVTASNETITITRNIATLATAAAHNFSVGRYALIEGINSSYNGTFEITDIPSPTTFSYNRAGTEASTASAGTARVGQRAQIAFEGISEITIENCQNEGFTPIDGIYYHQGGSTTAKGLRIRELHPEQQPMNSHIYIAGTGGGQVVVEGGSWTQGLIMMDATNFTTGNITWSHQSFLAGKWRAGGAIWNFVGYTGIDPYLSTLWDGSPPTGSALPIIRTAIVAREGAGLGNSGVLSYEGFALISTKSTFKFIAENVASKINMVLTKGVEIGLWAAAPNPATQSSSSIVQYFDEAKKTLNRQVKDSGGVSTISVDAYNQPGRYAGTGTPEGVVVAAVGSIYQRTDGGAGTCLYVKESGASNTGWIAK